MGIISSLKFSTVFTLIFAAQDGMVDQIVGTIVSAAHTGNTGDGKVFVWSVERAVRIQTGERNDAAV